MSRLSRIPINNNQSSPPLASTSTLHQSTTTSTNSFNFSNQSRTIPPHPSHTSLNRSSKASSSSRTTKQSQSNNNNYEESLRRQSNFSTLGLSPRRLSTSSTTTTTNNNKGTSKHKRRSSLFNHSTTSTLEEQEDEESMGQFDEGEEGEEEEEEEEWGTIERMRNWRNDSMTQHLYGTAEFWGSKIFEMTGNPNDAFWLSQTLFYTHQYTQAEKLLTLPRLPHSSLSSTSPPIPSTSSLPIAKKLTDTSLACRYLAAQCQVRLGKWEEGLEMLGRGESLFLLNSTNGNGGVEGGNQAEDEEQGDGGIKLKASMAHLRGIIHLHLGATELAKEAFIEALTRDVKCYESFQVLVGGEMMSNEEEWEFIQGLPFLAQTGDDADFVRMMYTVRLKKMTRHQEMSEARQRLIVEHGLAEDPDVMFSFADEMYTSLRFAECYKLTSRILAVHSSHRPTLPLHISCLHHLPNLRSKLFLLAHELVENEPDDAISWYAVGLWYFSGKRWEESRRFFGKSVLIDSRFGPSWIAFAHSYAYEGEHDQAITAYSTSLRHFQGSHLPLLFIGMQHLGLANIELAEEYLLAAKEGSENSDPLVWNELGVVALLEGKNEEAVQSFLKALELSVKVQGSRSAWSITHLNLGHAYRKLEQYENAHASFRRVIALDPRSSAAYAGLGLTEHYLGHYQESIARYHEALSISPGEPVTCELLKLVLEDTDNQISVGVTAFPGLPTFILRNIDDQVALLDNEISKKGNKRRKKGVVEEEEDEVVSFVDTSQMSEDIVLEERTEEDGGSDEGETMDMTG